MSDRIDSNQVSLTVETGGSARRSDEREVDVQYYTAGDGSQNGETRPPLVLLHGIGLDASRVSFRHAIPALSQNRRVIAFDFPGHGESEKPDVRYTTAFYRAVLEQFLSSLGLENVCLMGTSMGGCVALGHALDAPETVRRLVLVNSYGLGGDAPWRPAASIALRWPGVGSLLWGTSTGTRNAVRASLQGLVGRAVPDDLVEDVYKIVQKSHSGRALTRWQRSEFRLSGLKTNYMPQLSDFSVPTLFVHGAADPILPAEWSVRAAQRCPHATLELIDGCGHWTARERPEAFNQIVKRFVGPD
jgi:pimeloyl-ACP methyl ester carboxylesterase